MIEVDSSSDSTKLALRYEGDLLRFGYLDEKNASAAKESVRLIARALGVKRCAFAIDGIFAYTFEACVRSVSKHYHTTEGSYRERLKWAGLGVVARRLRLDHGMLCVLAMNLAQVRGKLWRDTRVYRIA